MTFGENIKLLREECGYSLKQVEIKTGINNGNLSRYERDLNLPSIEQCIKLSELYQVSLDELIGNSSRSSSPLPSLSRDDYTEEERDLVSAYRELDPSLQKLLWNMIETWQKNTASEKETAKKRLK